MLASETEIQESYQGPATASAYVENRFASELMRLLHERQVRSVNRVMEEKRPGKSLEIAPGPGRITRDVCASGELVCLEFNEGMIAEGRRCCREEVRWVQGNAFELPLENEFDFVYSFRFVRHFHREDRNRLYAQIRKVLRPGGLLVLDAVNESVSRPLREANPEAYPIYDKLYAGEAELRSELEAAGFEVMDVVPVQRWFNLQYRAQVLLGPRSRWMCRAAIRLLERAPVKKNRNLEWIVTCRLK
jgi:ubiquinone/menaquinone biosynthesis C-methylase UbiE